MTENNKFYCSQGTVYKDQRCFTQCTYCSKKERESKEQPVQSQETGEETLQHEIKLTEQIALDYQDLYYQAEKEIECLKRDIEQLRDWKESAISVTPDMQEIAKLINVPLGHSIHDKIIPWIKWAKAEIERLKPVTTEGRTLKSECGWCGRNFDAVKIIEKPVTEPSQESTEAEIRGIIAEHWHDKYGWDRAARAIYEKFKGL